VFGNEKARPALLDGGVQPLVGQDTGRFGIEEDPSTVGLNDLIGRLRLVGDLYIASSVRASTLMIPPPLSRYVTASTRIRGQETEQCRLGAGRGRTRGPSRRQGSRR
jgi:hypothetical protein